MTPDINQQEEEEEREITARFSTDELVKGWQEREPRQPSATPIIIVGARTDLGRIRENNEDKFDFYEPDDPTILATRGSLYAVADGMGGHAAGQIASELALKNMLSAYYNSVAGDIPSALREAVTISNDTVFDIAAMIPGRTGMGTTLTVLVVIEDRCFLAQVGDSRAYLIRNGAIRQVTEDHSWVAEQVRRGGMTEEEAEMSPYRNVITRCIGTQKDTEPDIFDDDAIEGDIWVLCSDGLSGHVHADEILQIAGKHCPSEASRQLIELANARGGRDNITTVVVKISDIVRLSEPPEEKSKKRWSPFSKE